MVKSKMVQQRCFLLAGRAGREAATPVTGAGGRDQDVKILYRLASDYDASDPSLAAKLRAIAARL